MTFFMFHSNRNVKCVGHESHLELSNIINVMYMTLYKKLPSK